MSSLTERLLTALIGIPLILTFLYLGGIFFYLLVLMATILALAEYRGLWELKNCQISNWIYLAGAGLITLSGLELSAYSLVFIFTVFVTLFIYHGLQGTWQNSTIATGVALVIIGLVYIAWPLSLLLPLREYGFDVVLLLLALVFGSDTAAFFIGSRFGRHPLAPRISPKKSIEGAIGALITSSLVGAAWSIFFSTSLPIIAGIFLGLLASILAQTGDLLESMLKRFCGAKDSGKLLPGHGGILDRLDSLLLVIPLIYYLANLIK